MNKFTYFNRPISNTTPRADITLHDLHKVIIGNYHKDNTSRLREIVKSGDKKKARMFKANNFDYVTFSGTFTARGDNYLKELSGYLCIDIDHERGLDKLKKQLIEDKVLNVQLVFVSPSGDGLKVIITDPNKGDYKQSYSFIDNYVRNTYSIKIDATSDVSRACFVCHDPAAWIRPEPGLERLIKKHPIVKELIQRLDLVEVKAE